MQITRTPLIAMKIVALYVGHQGILADSLGIARSTMASWMKRGYPSARYVKQMCEMTGGDVKPKDLRPDLY